MSRHAKTLTKFEFESLIHSVRNSPRNRMILFLLHYGGLRVGEVANLKWKNIVDGDGKLKDVIPLFRDQTKGRKSRNVFVGKVLKAELEAYSEACSVNSDGNDRRTESFIRTRQGAFSANSLSQLVSSIHLKAGIGGTSHSGRRSFITRLHNAGTPLKVIQELVGHQDLTTTQSYIDVRDDQMRDAVNGL